jgi:hypothetical protein
MAMAEGNNRPTTHLEPQTGDCVQVFGIVNAAAARDVARDVRIATKDAPTAV